MSTGQNWAPRPRLIITGWVLAGCATVWFLIADEPNARLFAVLAAAMLTAVCLHGSLIRPRLSVVGPGIVIRELTGRRFLAWEEFDHQIRRRRRFGIEVAVLEIDARPPHEHLVVLTPLDLGEDPEEVDVALRRLARRPDGLS